MALWNPPALCRGFLCPGSERFHLGGGNLEGEQEQAGAAGVYLVLGDALDDLIEGVLELAPVDWSADGEGAAAVAGLALTMLR